MGKVRAKFQFRSFSEEELIVVVHVSESLYFRSPAFAPNILIFVENSGDQKRRAQRI